MSLPVQRAFSCCRGPWSTCRLYDLASWTNGLAFRDSQFSPTGAPVIKIAEIKNGIMNQTKFTQQTFGNEYRVQRGDMLFSWSGSPDTSIDVFWYRGPEGWLNQHIFKVEPRKDVDQVFFYYILKYLKSLFIEIAKNKQTTGLGHVTIADLKSISIQFPSLATQRAVAKTLGSLDDKIELNRRMNQTLEAMAQTLYKHWFVDFGPFRDGEFVDSELGPIPKGWRALPVSSIGTYINGMAFRQSDLSDKGLPVIKIAELNNGLGGNTKRYSGEYDPKYRIEDGDVLFSWSGSLDIYLWAGGSALLNQHIFRVLPNGTLSKAAMYCVLKYVIGDFQSIAAARATTMGHITKDHLNSRKVAVPPESTLNRIEPILDTLFRAILQNLIENRTLAETRDYLLPKLLSGEIEIKVAEKEVGTAL